MTTSPLDVYATLQVQDLLQCACAESARFNGSFPLIDMHVTTPT